MTIRRFMPAIFFCLVFFFLIGTDSANAAGTSGDFAAKLIEQFYTKSSAWASVLQGYAFHIFKYLVIFETCWFGVKIVLRHEEIARIFGEFCIMVTFAGFMFSVITYYPEWTQNIIRGLSKISTELGGGEITDSPLQVGWQIVGTILSKVSGWSPLDSLGLVFAGLVILVCFALITARMVLIICEAYIAMNAAILLLGFGGSSIFKDYAINTMRYAFSVAFKLFVMQLLLGIGISFIEGFEISTASFEEIFLIIGASIILLALVNQLPNTVAGIISGSHVGGGTGLGAASGAVVGGAAAAGGAMLGAATGGATGGVRDSLQNLKDATDIASMEGKGGLGKLTSVAGTLRSAHRDATGHTGQKMRTTMQERLQSKKMEKEKEGEED